MSVGGELEVLDTGIDDAVAAEPGGRQVAPAIRFHVDRPLRAQLTTPVDVLALSHLHVDHVGNLDLFPDARVLLQRDELDAAHGPDAKALTYVPASYADLVLDHVVAVDGEHDVFGDGTVVLVPLPGHTPGHQGLLVTLARSGPVLIAGDVAYDGDDYAAERVRADNVDLEASLRSIRAVKRIERDRGAAVWLHHDRAAQAGVALSPAVHR